MNVFKKHVIIRMDTYSSLRNSLLEWYKTHKRELPWRDTSDPYKIWVSEVILQQTQVIQGTGYYYRFINRFPDVASLATADEQEVLKYWQGLGYYSRARNLHFAAKQIVDEHNGCFPESYSNILALKGVGEYTAAAISSIAFNKPYAVVDGNVSRVLSRLFLVQEPINESSGKSIIKQLADELLDKSNPGTFNQALMEFGALHCKPANPKCSTCTLSDFCLAFQKNLTTGLPLKTKKAKQKKRYFLYYVIIDKNLTWISKRTKNDIWKGLYEFPLLESDTVPADEAILHSLNTIFFKPDSTFEVKYISEEYSHILTHQIIKARFIVIESKDAPINSEGFLQIKKSGISDYPVSRLMEKFLEEDNLYFR